MPELLELTKMQQLIIDTLASQGGSLGSTEVNRSSLASLVGRELVYEDGNDHFLTESGWEHASIEVASEEKEQRAVASVETITVGEDVEEPVQPEQRSSYVLELGHEMVIQTGVDKKTGKPLTARIPVGTPCHVIGWEENVTRSGRVVWYIVAAPNIPVSFMVSHLPDSPTHKSAHHLYKVDYTPDEN